MFERQFLIFLFTFIIFCSGEEYPNKDYTWDSGWEIVFLAPPGSSTLNLANSTRPEITDFDIQLKRFVEALSDEQALNELYPETLKNDYQRDFLIDIYEKSKVTFLLWGYGHKDNTYIIDLMTYPKVIPNANNADAHFIANFRPVLFRQKLVQKKDESWYWTTGGYEEDIRGELNKISAKRLRYNEVVEIQKLSGVKYPLNFKQKEKSKPLVFHTKVRRERLTMLKKGVLKGKDEPRHLSSILRYRLYKNHDIYYPTFEELVNVMNFNIHEDYYLDLKDRSHFKTEYEKFLLGKYKGGTLKVILEKEFKVNDDVYHVSIVRQVGRSPVFDKKGNKFVSEKFYGIAPIYLKKVGASYERYENLQSTYFRLFNTLTLKKTSEKDYKGKVIKLCTKDPFLTKLMALLLK